jgi:plasmid stabilization system protein ParE
VYPGATEEVCVPVLEKLSGLKFNVDFFCGYSPERINPGDKEHRLTTIKKVTSGSTPDVAEAVDQLYKEIITAGTHKASSIRVTAIRQGVKVLSLQPGMGRPVEDMNNEFRDWIIDFGDSGYVARFRLDAHNVIILAVRHQEASF